MYTFSKQYIIWYKTIYEEFYFILFYGFIFLKVLIKIIIINDVLK